MWNCPKCIKPRTLLDQSLQYEGLWQQVHFVPYTQIYQCTSIAYRGIDISLNFNGIKSRATIVRVSEIQDETLTCTCGETMRLPPLVSGTLFFVGIDFFKKYIRKMHAPRIESCETLVKITESDLAADGESSVRDYILRHIRGSYLDMRQDDQWLLWYRP